MDITKYHVKFPGSVSWRVTAEGVQIKGNGVQTPFILEMQRAESYAEKHKVHYHDASNQYKVPVELLLACSMTESQDPLRPSDPPAEECVRQEPGYISDAKTPMKVSAGLCQMLLSTAKEVTKMPGLTREWLFDPRNAIRACAMYMRWQKDHKGTEFDPVLVAAAYNAGGLYENQSPKNRWKLKMYPIGSSQHVDRFIRYYGASCKLTGQSLAGAFTMRQSLAERGITLTSSVDGMSPL